VKEQAILELMKMLEKGEQSARENGWISIEDVEKIIAYNE
jgi:hypothetical protein